MRTVTASCLFVFALLFEGAAYAQIGRLREGPISAPSSPASPPTKVEIQKRIAEWLKTCLADWDPATHMSKEEWRTTCNRVASERGEFLLENPDAFVDRNTLRRR